MPFDDPDPTDPQMLVGVMLPSGPEAMRDMAYVFAEEFARLGHTRDEILRLFRNPFYGGAHGVLSLFTNPFYAGAHQIYQALGADAVRGIVEECVTVFGRTAARIQDAPLVCRENLLMIGTDGPIMTNDK